MLPRYRSMLSLHTFKPKSCRGHDHHLPQVTANVHLQTMLSPIYILFVLVVLGMPFYESYERLYHPSETHIPRQIKFTTQSTVGFSTAIHSFCDVARLRRSSETSAFVCPALAVGGGSFFGAAMTRLWNDEDWAVLKRLRFGGSAEYVIQSRE